MSGITKALGAVVLAGAFTVGGGAAVAAPSAPVGPAAWSDCGSGQWCMWDGDGGSGALYLDYDVIADDDLSSPNQGQNDRANSVWNRSARTICVYWDKDFSGNSIRYNAGVQATLPVSWKNKVSSYRTLPSGISSCNYD